MRTPPPVKMNRWTLLLVPSDVKEDTVVRVAAVIEAPDTVKPKDIINKLRSTDIPAAGFYQMVRPSERRGISSPIQIIDAPPEDSTSWQNVLEMNKSKLTTLAVFKTQGEFANLIGVSPHTVTSALYNARRRNKEGIATVKGFKIARLEEVYRE